MFTTWGRQWYNLLREVIKESWPSPSLCIIRHCRLSHQKNHWQNCESSYFYSSKVLKCRIPQAFLGFLSLKIFIYKSLENFWFFSFHLPLVEDGIFYIFNYWEASVLKPFCPPLSQDFRLVHYAGEVTYSVDGFLDKNNDLLYRDLKEVSTRLWHWSSWWDTWNQAQFLQIIHLSFSTLSGDVKIVQYDQSSMFSEVWFEQQETTWHCRY